MIVYVVVMFLQNVLVFAPSIAVITFTTRFLRCSRSAHSSAGALFAFLEAFYPLVNTVDHFLTPTSATCDLLCKNPDV